MNMRTLALWVCAVVACALVTQITALHEDQVGKFDWFRDNIGQVRHAIWHPDPKVKRVFVATESGVVAGLSHRQGTTQWRHTLPETESMDALRLRTREVLSVSGSCKNLRLFSVTDGALLWEEIAYSSRTAREPTESCDAVLSDESEFIAVLSHNVVSLHATADGAAKWTYKAPKGAMLTRVTMDERGVHAFGRQISGRSGATGAYAITLEFETGKPLSKSDAAIPAPKVASSKGFCASHALLGATIVCGDDTGDVHVLDRSKRAFTTTPLKDISKGAKSSNGVTLKPLGNSASEFVLSIGGTQFVRVAVDPSTGAAKGTHIWSGENYEFAASATPENKGDVVVAVQSNTNEVKLDAQLPDAGPLVSEYAVTSGEHGRVVRVWPNAYLKKDGSVGMRTLVATQGHSLLLLKDGSLLWTREESLASIVDTAFVDLPPASQSSLYDDEVEGQGNTGNPISKWIKRVVKHAQELRDALTQLAASGGKSTSAASAAAAEKRDDMIGDRFSFHKLIVVMTKPGKMLGVLSENGRVVWQKYYQASPVLDRFFITRTSFHYQLECVVLGRTSTGPDSNSFMSWIDPITGSETGTQALNFQVKQAMLLPLIDAEHRQLLITVDSALKAHIHPDTKASRAIFDASNDVFFYNADKGTDGKPDQIVGYRVSGKAGDYYGSQAWSVVFAADEKLQTLAARTPETVKSAGRVLGDRTVLFKYLNPNTVVVGTLSASASGAVVTGAGAPGGDGSALREKPNEVPSPVVRMYIMDAVTGAVVHSVEHHNARGPVLAVQSEHVVLYSYWNIDKHRTELSVIELYEKAPSDLSIPKLISGDSQPTAFESRRGVSPNVLTQAYMLPAGLKTMGVTSSALGITTKQFLLGLESDQLFALDKRWVDPRRPMTPPTEEDREEGLVPYHPLIMMAPTSFLTYNRTVANIRGVKSTATRLESTTLVFAYGLDLFFTRATPAKTFDSLNDEFPYAALILSTISLIGLTGFTWTLYKRKELNQKWQ